MPRKLQLKLIHKGMLIVLLPLLVQGLVYVQLKTQLAQAQKEATLQDRARTIQMKVNILLMACSRLIDSYIGYWVERKKKKQPQISFYRTQIKKETASLVSILYLEPGYAQPAQNLETTGNLFLQQLDDANLDTGDHALTMFQAFHEHKQIIHTGRKFTDALRDIGDQQQSKLSNAYAQQQSFGLDLNRYLDYAVILNCAMALALMLYFIRGTVKHLVILKANSRRLAENEVLLAPITGADEIAEVDRTFHEMAGKLKAATDREKAMMDLLDSANRRMVSVISTMPVALIVCTESGTVESLNQAGSNLFGYSTEELAGKPVHTLFLNTDKHEPVTLLEKWQSASIEHAIPMEGLSSSNEGLPLEIAVVTFDAPEGRRFLITAVDISERYRLEKLKRDFLAMVSHDIRSPLMSIDASLELIKSRDGSQLPADVLSRIDGTQKNAHRLMGLVTRLLDLERLESGIFEFEKSAFDLKQIANHSWQALEHLAESRKITWSGPENECIVQGDQANISQVIDNLLGNAIKFSPDGGEITCTIECQDHFAIVSIKDQGCGIPAGDQQMVFDKFSQTGSRRSRRKGTGLGLAISKTIVEAHGGEIGVDSVEAEGSRFWFKLPRTIADAKSTID